MSRRNRAIKEIANDLERLRINGQDDMAADKAESLATYTHEMTENILASQPDEQKTSPKRCHIIISILEELRYSESFQLFVWLCVYLPLTLMAVAVILGVTMGLADKYVWQPLAAMGTFYTLKCSFSDLITGITVGIFVSVVLIIIMSNIDNH